MSTELMKVVERQRVVPIAARRRRVAILVAAIGVASGCDLTVTNAGPVQDQFLDQRSAHAGIVNGAAREFAEALNFLSLTTGGVTREINAAGNVCNFGITSLQVRGILGDDEWEESCSPIWTSSHRARWAAEDGLRRFRSVLDEQEFASYRPAAELSLLAGYANRLQGETMCFAVIDGGPAQPYTVHLERAEAAFTQAMEIGARSGATNVVTAARAGRASVRVGLKKWDEAVADARQIPSAFVHQIRYFEVEDAQNNRLWRSNANRPARTNTVWNTPTHDYYLATQDPRTPWGQNPAIPFGDAAVAGYGQVPWRFQLKYDRATSPINVSSGWEMRLIEAEARLRAGDWQEGMRILNQRRAALSLAPWTATNLEEAWTHLKRERGIELWLEARRLSDLRRWNEERTPGALHPLEITGGAIPLSPNRSYCAPISVHERETNPNLAG
jgi:starch-binding outer membrane protein, SusD/RagB family